MSPLHVRNTRVVSRDCESFAAKSAMSIIKILLEKCVINNPTSGAIFAPCAPAILLLPLTIKYIGAFSAATQFSYSCDRESQNVWLGIICANGLYFIICAVSVSFCISWRKFRDNRFDRFARAPLLSITTNQLIRSSDRFGLIEASRKTRARSRALNALAHINNIKQSCRCFIIRIAKAIEQVDGTRREIY